MNNDNEIFDKNEADGIFSKILRAGRRTYFFDVRETRAGDYYLTITESKKNPNEDGSFYYKKHKIYLYKEDFAKFKEILDETTQFVIDEKGEEVISERHQKDYVASAEVVNSGEEKKDTDVNSFTDINFDDI